MCFHCPHFPVLRKNADKGKPIFQLIVNVQNIWNLIGPEEGSIGRIVLLVSILCSLTKSNFGKKIINKKISFENHHLYNCVGINYQLISNQQQKFIHLYFLTSRQIFRTLAISALPKVYLEYYGQYFHRFSYFTVILLA